MIKNKKTNMQFWSLKERLHWLSVFAFFNGLIFIVLGSVYFQLLFQSNTLTFSTMSAVENKSFVFFYAHLNFFSYMFSLSLFVAVVIFPIALIIKRRYLLMMVMVIAFSLAVLFLFIDQQSYQVYHFHLNLVLLKLMLSSLAMNPSVVEVSLISLIIFSIIVLEFFIASFTFKNKKYFSIKLCLKTYFISLLSLAFCYLTLINSMNKGENIFALQTPYYPLYDQIFKVLTLNQDNNQKLNYFTNRRFTNMNYSSAKLKYPINPLICPSQLKNKPNVILFIIDTLRFDSFNSKEMPNLYKRKNQFSNFKEHWSGGNSTKPGLFSMFYGLPHTYWQSMIDAKKPPLLNSKFKEAGYSLNLLMSSYYQDPPFEKNVYLDFTSLYTASDVDILKTSEMRDKIITNKVVKLLGKNFKEPLFLNVFYDAVHAYCENTNIHLNFKPIVKNCNRILSRAHSEQPNYYNRYRNTVHFVDSQMEEVFKIIDQKNLWQNSIVIVTSDHGEEFDDNRQGYWGHTGNYTKYQLKVPLLVHWPKKEIKDINYKTSHYDLAPTLLEDVLACDKNNKNYSVGQNLFDINNRDKYLIAGSYTNTAVVTPKRTMVFMSVGTLQIQDSQAKVMPEVEPELSILKQAWADMNKFYQK